jgi:hypothetical protein
MNFIDTLYFLKYFEKQYIIRVKRTEKGDQVITSVISILKDKIVNEKYIDFFQLSGMLNSLSKLEVLTPELFELI